MKDVFTEAIQRHQAAVEVFEQSGYEVISRIAEETIRCFGNGGCVYLMGNGGSAADCQHIAGEFMGRFHRERDPLPAVALTTDSSVLTCIGNDYGYNEVFTRGVKALVGEADLVWAFSTSGESGNIFDAAKIALEKGATVIAFTGRSGSELERFAHVTVCAGVEQTSHAQEIHQLAYHIICNLIDCHYTD